MNYLLKLYDEPLIKFTMENEVGEGFKATMNWIVKPTKYNLLPYNIYMGIINEYTGARLDDINIHKTLTKWLNKRTIPKNREFVEEILHAYGLSINDKKGIIEICKGLSLNDSYWVVPEDFDGKFADYNLYENKFSEALSLVAYTGVGGGVTPFTTSPEYTTGGMLRKAWRRIDDKIILYKGGTGGFANTGLEPYSEYYACQIAEKMKMDPVMYGLEQWKGILASICVLFTDIDTAFIPIGRIVKEGGYKKVLEWAKNQSNEMYEYFRSILCLDALIYNQDRHFGNFGVLRENKTGKIIAPAPVFDNGLSLFNYGMIDNLRNLEEYRQTRTAQTGDSFDDIAKTFCGKKQKEQLRHLIDFKFIPHELYNWEPERYEIIEKFIQKRVIELLNIIND